MLIFFNYPILALCVIFRNLFHKNLLADLLLFVNINLKNVMIVFYLPSTFLISPPLMGGDNGEGEGRVICAGYLVNTKYVTFLGSNNSDYTFGLGHGIQGSKPWSRKKVKPFVPQNKKEALYLLKQILYIAGLPPLKFTLKLLKERRKAH